MAQTSIDVEVKAKLTVDDSTAVACLKLLEVYLNDNRYVGIVWTTKPDGSKELQFKDLRNDVQPDEKIQF